MTSPSSLLAAAFCLAGCAGVLAQVRAPQAVPPQVQVQAMSFETAWDRLKTGSDQMAAAQAAIDSKDLQERGLKGLGGPVVSLSAVAYAYNANLNVNLDPINQQLAQASQRLPIPLQNLPIPLPVPQFPSNYTFNRHDTGTTRSISAVWPIYAGGASDAVRGVVTAQGNEARADADKTGHELATQLVQRYFGAQLAAKAAALRQAALDDIRQHDAATAKMLAAGVISRIERLQAQAAYEEAKRNALKAQDDAEMTAIALARTVKSNTPVKPDTPLFVLTQAVEPLPHFLDQALQRHPGLAKVNAKKMQAEQLHHGQEALRKPQVFAFGQRELKTGNADWIGGIGVRWTLFDAMDRDALAASSNKQIEQAERTGLQARSDISLLVEKNWRALEQARRQFLATEPGVTLAHEVLRLRTAALREGTGTALELIDAEVNQTKVETERAQVAYEYVMALASLLESCGLSDEFSSYIRRADVKVY
ncbi:TolC family protein [Polaromonas sp. SM01]|uniref:TolC family protein n=1 Tax=Polaromonas sp. SM01 TaxID=3085630 RepID=UPI002980E0CD|nr:TolC family protein [Polaromonas sp. SM01]MDW5444980.1 TolC family protein [Polaromonas sp. SM01]